VHPNREGSKTFGAWRGRGGRFNGDRGRGRERASPEEGTVREHRIEAGNIGTQQDPNTVA